MAIKDALLHALLNTPASKNAQNRYKRLRSIENVSSSNDAVSVLKTQEIIEDKLETNQRQIEDKQETIEKRIKTKAIDSRSYAALTGLQLKITHFIFQHCKLTDQKVTRPLSIEFIAASCQINVSSIRKTIQRLEQKGILLRNQYKIGRNGWTCYELPSALYNEILSFEENLKPETNRGQT